MVKMGFRWYGSQDDPIPLKYIRQIPGCEQVVGALFDIPVGEVWPKECIKALKDEVEAAGLKLEVIESVNIHDDIKIGLPTRDRYIENYKQTICNLAEYGIKVICYNFMPVFDWVRTDMRFELPDGSTGLAYRHEMVQGTLQETLDMVTSQSEGFTLPGWELERLSDLKSLFDAYADVDEDKLAANMAYFLQAIMPTCEEMDIKMAVHTDDPPRPLFGLPRIVKNAADLRRIAAMWDSPYMASQFARVRLVRIQRMMCQRLFVSLGHKTRFRLSMRVISSSWVTTVISTSQPTCLQKVHLTCMKS